jgi:iron(III) transport system ATP-binding protein
VAGITITQMTKKYGANAVVDDLNLTIEDGEFFTFLGPSGCGKTTTLRCIAGLETPDAGSIAIGGATVFDASRKTWVPPERRNAGMVFQSYALWPHMSVLGNVTYPLRRRGVGAADARRAAGAALDMVSLQGMSNRSISALSGGQQQRVALARALVSEPRIVLFDEPLSNLDAKLRADMRDQIGAVAREVGTTSVYVTHDQTEALTLSDRIAVMKAGKIQQIGSPEDIYARPQTPFVADFVGFDNLLSGRASTSGSVGAVDVEGLGAVRVHGLDATVGTEVVIGIRASDVQIVAEGDNRPNVLSGTVEHRVFLGEHVDLKVRVGNEQIKIRQGAAALSRRSRPTTVGDEVTLALAPDAMVVMANPSTEETTESS